MDLFTGVEILTQVVTYLMIVSGIPPCWSMVKSGSVRGVPYPFFLMSVVNAAGAMGYGVLVANSPIFYINLTAFIFNLTYVLLYVHTSQSKNKPLFLMTLCALFLGLLYLYMTRIVPDESRLDYTGRIMLVVTVVLLSTPILEIRDCLQVGNASDMSLVMLAASLLCTGSWFLYGFLLKDFYIYGPNIIGVMVTVAKLVVWLLYKDGKPAKPHRS